MHPNDLILEGYTGDEYCQLCYTDGLAQAPCVQLDCKHIFHLPCLLKNVRQRWISPRINFNFMKCPACKGKISAPGCPDIHAEIMRASEIETLVKKKALERAKFEGIDKDSRLSENAPDNPYYNNLQEYSMYKLAYYMCFKCKVPYFGGKKDCIAA